MKKFALLLFATSALSSNLLAQDTGSPTGMTGGFSGTIPFGSGSFDPLERNATRSITDIVVPGAVVPFTYTRTWYSRKGAPTLANGWSQNPWTNNWCWTVTMNQDQEYESNLPTNPNDIFYGYYIAYPDGKVIQFNKPGTPAHSPPGGVGTYNTANKHGCVR